MEKENSIYELISIVEDWIALKKDRRYGADLSGDEYQELLRRQKAGEIDPFEYEVFLIKRLQEEKLPITRADVQNKAIVIYPQEFDGLYYIEFMSSIGEVMKINFADLDHKNQPFILFPENLG
jgi:hypothetical protein